MVIQLETEEPAEAPIRRSERARYVLVKNHVREVGASVDSQSKSTDTEGPVKQRETHRSKRRKTSRSESNAASTSEETRDLEELRQVYFKCRRLLETIEIKYGHKLNLYSERDGSSKARDNLKVDSDAFGCRTNKKIRFDESGSGVEVECDIRCSVGSRVQVEQEASGETLPDDVTALSTLLRDPTLDATTRHAAVDKLRMLRATLSDELRYHRRALLERVRSHPDEELDFVGTNLGALPGYLYSCDKQS